MMARIHSVLIVLALLATGIVAAELVPSKGGLVDRPLSAFQAELLELAFNAGMAIPAEADLKDRSKAQEAVLAACLQLHQPGRVLKHIGEIGDWRRGAVYADLAAYCVRNGAGADVQKYLRNAAEIAKTGEDWSRDRIRVKIAQVHASLGNAQQATAFQAGVEPAEQGKVIQPTSRPGDGGDFEAQMRELDRLIAIDKFDVLMNAQNSALKIYDIVYNEPDRRFAVEQKIRASLDRLPIFIRIDLLMAMGKSAMEHNDQAEAKKLVSEAQTLKDASKWMVEDEIPVMARLAVHQFRTGDKEKARKDVASALALFDAERAKVLVTERAGTLLAIAEAFHAVGDRPQAIAVYKKALAEGASNPNGRPRALDLSATCRSLALNAVEPDAELWGQIRQTIAGLRSPW